jgi:hypothetical protein
VSTATTAKEAPSGLLPVDALIAGIEADPAGHITALTAKRDQPHVSIEVLSDPYVDEDPQRGPAALAGQFIERYEQLRKPFEESGAAGLVICRGAPLGDPAVWEETRLRLASGPARCVEALAAGPEAAEERAAIFSVRLTEEAGELGDRTLEEPFAYLVVLAWRGALGRGEAEARAVGSRRLLRALTGSLARNAPTYVLCVSDGDAGTEALARECENLRVSLVLAGVDDDAGLVTSTRAGQERGQPPRSVAVAHCPRFRGGTSGSGMTRIRLDVWKGEAEVAFNRALGSDRPQRAVQTVAPLCSASRVAPSERRLRSRVEHLIRSARVAAKAGTQTVDLAKLDKFENEVTKDWNEHGYARLCNPAGDIPLPVTRHTSYHLLLLVRERGEGEYDVMLSNHSPLRQSPLSDWNTLLMPAFKDPRTLLENLRSDVLRQAKERAEDVERVAHARQFEAAVGRILDDEEKGNGDALWADETREIASRQVRKISPTTGAVTEFDYQLVTLMPLIERPTAKVVEGEGDGDDAVDTRRLTDLRRIIEWFDGLDTVASAEESSNPARELPLEALEDGGSALRWDPSSAMAEDPGLAGRRKRRAAAPGAIWFPLRADPERWRDCPSIDSRNGDVMAWAASVLAAARAEQKRLPPELVLGRYAGSGEYEVDDEELPFEREEKQEDPKEHCLSTKEALERVEYAPGSGLSGDKPYEDADIRRVFLSRESAEVAGVARQVIAVYGAEAGEEFGPEVKRRGRLGVLRPVQRYVLRAGMERAAEINAKVIPLLAERGDSWGYVRLRKGATPRLVSVTTPIVEQAWKLDLDGLSTGGETEFVVCDGNHRIVSGVWKSESGWMPAVAVVGELDEPYYARPFGRFEWDATADNVLEVSPDLASKYLTRSVDWDDDMNDVDREKLASVPKARWYRRYFRDLTTGFGYMGGQGGRW